MNWILRVAHTHFHTVQVMYMQPRTNWNKIYFCFTSTEATNCSLQHLSATYIILVQRCFWPMTFEAGVDKQCDDHDEEEVAGVHQVKVYHRAVILQQHIKRSPHIQMNVLDIKLIYTRHR